MNLYEAELYKDDDVSKTLITKQMAAEDSQHAITLFKRFTNDYNYVIKGSIELIEPNMTSIDEE